MIKEQLTILDEILDGNLRDSFKKHVESENEMLLEIIDKYFILEEEKEELNKWMNKEIYISEKTINKLLTVLEIKRQRILFKEWLDKQQKA